jgi:methyl-accepting chemotaxis protein
MKINQPVTGKEIALDDQTVIVSKTDLKGIITYVNRDFIDIAGFTEAELLGKNHNIIRHPEMPAAAFQDLWDTIRAGRPWVGIVKNRAKNGDHYWVKANVTAIRHDGEVVEYVSVRCKASREEIDSAQTLYRQLNAGQVKAPGLFSRLLGALRGMSLLRKFYLVMAVMAISFAASGVISSLPMRQVQQDWTQYHAQVAERQALLSAIKSAFGYGGAIHNFKNYVIRGLPKYAERFRHDHDVLSAKIQQYQVLPDLVPEEDEALKTVQGVADEYQSMLVRIMPLVQAGESVSAIDKVVKVDDSPALRAFEVLDSHYRSLTSSVTAGLEHTLAQGRWISLLMPLTGFILLFGFFYLALTRGVLKPMKLAIGHFRRIADGYYFDDIELRRGDEIGDLLRGLKDMQTKLGYDVNAARSQAEAATRVKTALDCVSTQVMVTDQDDGIIYLNRALQQMFGAVEADLRESLPDFNASDLLGKNMRVFESAEPGGQGRLLQRASKAPDTLFTVGRRTFRLIANPVTDAAGASIGTAVEWADLTTELQAQEEERERLQLERRQAAENLRIRTALDNVSSSVMLADAEHRIIYMNRTVQAMFHTAEADIRMQLPGFRASALMGANIDDFHRDPSHQRRLLDQLNATHRSEIQIGGRVFGFVAGPVIAEQGERLGTVVEWTDRTDEVAVEQEVAQIVNAAHNGDLERRIDTSGKQGFYLTLAEGINDLIGEVSRVFSDLSSVLQSMSEGDLGHSISSHYSGGFAQVKRNVNHSLKNLNDIIGRLRESTDGIRGAAGEIASGNNNLSSRTEQQASNLQETASSMEELTSTVRNNADNAQQANALAANARNKAEDGGQVVSRAVQAMEEINRSSAKIAEIIGVIDEIAFQTNLLALNASVEAARAGEQGRGFAVVATEVRNLASRSAAAAKQIKGLIHDSVEKIQSGADLVNESGRTLEDIVSAVKKVGDIVAEIAAASAEQSAGIDQVNQAVTSMDEVTQQNAALAEQTSAASHGMEEKAAEMERLMSLFTLAKVDSAESGDRPDFDRVRIAHLSWKKRLRQLLNGQQLDELGRSGVAS